MPWKFHALSDVRRHACQLEKFLLLFERGCLNFFSGKRVKNSREALVPSTYKFLFEKGFFSSSLACRLHVSGNNGHRKRLFSRTLSKVEIFDDAVLLYSCGWMETEVHENDDVTVMDTS